MHPDPALIRRVLADEDATLALGGELAGMAGVRALVFLEGDLGAGKTTFARGFLHGRGWTDSVRSPTYPILRTYPLAPPVHHLDLYRLGGLEEVLGLDFEPLLEEDGILLVEWPDRLEGQFRPDWIVRIEPDGDGRVATLERRS